MEVTRADVEKVAQLARLRIAEQELSMFAEQLTSILNYVEQLKAVGTEGVAATSSPRTATDMSREDVVRASLPVEAALANAPEAEDGAFRVPKIIDAR